MKIMAIDFGETRTGVAICDSNEILAYPVKTIIEKNIDVLVKEIIKTAENFKAGMIVVGCPINMDGSFGEKAKISKNLSEKLAKSSNFKVTLWDERQTTMLAMKFLNQANTKKTKKKKIIDKIAATVILESFLSYRKNVKEQNR